MPRCTTCPSRGARAASGRSRAGRSPAPCIPSCPHTPCRWAAGIPRRLLPPPDAMRFMAPALSFRRNRNVPIAPARARPPARRRGLSFPAGVASRALLVSPCASLQGFFTKRGCIGFVCTTGTLKMCRECRPARSFLLSCHTLLAACPPLPFRTAPTTQTKILLFLQDLPRAEPAQSNDAVQRSQSTRSFVQSVSPIHTVKSTPSRGISGRDRMPGP